MNELIIEKQKDFIEKYENIIDLFYSWLYIFVISNRFFDWIYFIIIFISNFNKEMIFNNCKDKHCKEYIVDNNEKSSYLVKILIEMFDIIIEVDKIEQFC